MALVRHWFPPMASLSLFRPSPASPNHSWWWLGLFWIFPPGFETRLSSKIFNFMNRKFKALCACWIFFLLKAQPSIMLFLPRFERESTGFFAVVIIMCTAVWNSNLAFDFVVSVWDSSHNQISDIKCANRAHLLYFSKTPFLVVIRLVFFLNYRFFFVVFVTINFPFFANTFPPSQAYRWARAFAASLMILAVFLTGPRCVLRPECRKYSFCSHS